MKEFIFDELDLLIFILSGLIKIVIGSFTFINDGISREISCPELSLHKPFLPILIYVS